MHFCAQHAEFGVNLVLKESRRVKAAKHKDASADRNVVEMREALARKIADRAVTEPDTPTEIPGLRLYRRSVPTACASAAYEPSLVVFVQGQKRINVGKTIYICDGSNFLLTSVDLPVVSQVIKATETGTDPRLAAQTRYAGWSERFSRSRSFICARNLLTLAAWPSASPHSNSWTHVRGLWTFLTTPRDIPFLSSLIQREIIFRLLRSPQGKHLRAIATLGEQSHRTAKAVEWLRMNYAKPLRVEELATMARMGVSTLHHQFRSLTAMSPLQYQKQLRLHVARERMLNEGLDAASAAFEVGYESASQFNREYSRFFGQPPMRDIKARRLTGAATVRANA